MFTNSCEPTLPKPVYNSNTKHIDTTTLINNTSSSTISSPIQASTTSTIMTDINSTTVDNNAMTSMAHETTIDIKQRVPVKSIRVERDYSLGDGITRFQTEYPVELAGKITPEEFSHTITEINKIMDYADRLSYRVVLENILEIATIYISPLILSTHHQRAVRRLLTFIEAENSSVYYYNALSISDPVKAAFLFVEIGFYE